MVSVNPVLRCLMQVEDGLSRGEAIRDILLSWMDRASHGSGDGSAVSAEERQLEAEILVLLRHTEAQSHGGGEFPLVGAKPSLLRQAFFNTLLFGIEGHSVLSRLHELRIEIEQQLELDMKAHVDSLPLKMLAPLLLFMFPAFLILLLGPITSNFVEALK